MNNQFKTIEDKKPYIGLRPYDEENQDIFFGRDREREIIIDKLLANKLTLLFAGSGVGKSSLLRAAVIPLLKQARKESLDVVYYCDWVSDPLEELKEETIRVLKQQGKMAVDYDMKMKENLSLKKFFEICAAFASDPLVVLLDQFEEFFQYRRHKNKDFDKFVNEFSEVVTDTETPVRFLISMREDFALELNCFKNYLPTILFQNYFRLEKLEKEKARDVVRLPVEKLGFQYEASLLEKLLDDIAGRDIEIPSGDYLTSLDNNEPSNVEPAYLQIVCSQLWEEEKTNPNRHLREEAYDRKGGARGFVESYFSGVMNRFSRKEKDIASLVFNHLVTPRGTKIAYPLDGLSNLVKVDEKKLQDVLKKLEKARILRSQERKEEIWYELYHDIFCNIIYRWNEEFKARHRTTWMTFLSIITTAFILAIIIPYYLIYFNNYHLNLSSLKGISDNIEVHRGKLGMPNLFKIRKYQAESGYHRSQVEPDKIFTIKPIEDFDTMEMDLIGHLSLVNRIAAYLEDGEIDRALRLADPSISQDNMSMSRQVIDILAKLGSEDSYKILKKHLFPPENDSIRVEIIKAMAAMEPSLVIMDLIALLENKGIEVRKSAAESLGKTGHKKAVGPLIKALKDSNEFVRGNAAVSLGQIGSEKAIEPLTNALKDKNEYARGNAAVSLGQIGSEKAIEPLMVVLKGQNNDLRENAVDALGKINSEKVVELLIDELKDNEPRVRSIAAEALGRIGSEKAVEPLIEKLKDPYPEVQKNSAYALGQIGNEKAVEPLIIALKDQAVQLRRSAAEALGHIGKEKAEESLINTLTDTEALVRSTAAEALGRIGSEKAVDPLIIRMKDQDKWLQSYSTAGLCTIGHEKGVVPLIDMLKDQDVLTRLNAVVALSNIGSEKAVFPLIDILKDEEKWARGCAAFSLGEISSEQSIFPLLAALKDQDTLVRARAVEALGKIGSKKVVDPLIATLKDLNRDVRLEAAYALGTIGSDKAVKPLISALKSQDRKLRQNAAYALGKIGSEKAKNSLIEALRDQDKDVRTSALIGLGNIQGEDISERIKKVYSNEQEKPILRLTAAAILLKAGSDKGLQYIKKKSGSSEIKERIQTAGILGLVPSIQGIEILEKMLNAENPIVKDQKNASAQNADIKVLKEVIRALTSLKLPEVIEPLRKLAMNGEERMSFRLMAIDALGEIEQEAAMTFLLDLLEDKNDIIQYKTLITIGKIKS